jgi:hypothetical protein
MNITVSHNKIKYIVWQFADDQPELNIDGDELAYAQLGSTRHGCQCKLNGDHKHHTTITNKLKEITELFRDIESLQNV